RRRGPVHPSRFPIEEGEGGELHPAIAAADRLQVEEGEARAEPCVACGGEAPVGGVSRRRQRDKPRSEQDGWLASDLLVLEHAAPSPSLRARTISRAWRRHYEKQWFRCQLPRLPLVSGPLEQQSIVPAILARGVGLVAEPPCQADRAGIVAVDQADRLAVLPACEQPVVGGGGRLPGVGAAPDVRGERPGGFGE